jgi:ligand-binding sensor domain-containing protein
MPHFPVFGSIISTSAMVYHLMLLIQSLRINKALSGFSTQDGLNRYDGVNFKIYRHDIRNPNSLASSGVYQMTLDSKGNIWMATDAALSEYIPATDSFKNFFVATKVKKPFCALALC